ncbi:MAG: Flp pilus assembly protein CpaB [Bdellovibrionota bacterium]
MNNNRAFTISFLVAAAAVALVHSYVVSSEDGFKQAYGADRVVVVAARDIKELDFLDETNLKTIPVPGNFAQPGTASSLDEFKATLAIAPIAAGEQITRTKVTMAGVRPGLARQVAAGKRAVTIRINDETGVAKLLKPGDRVDVAATFDPSGSGNKLNFETRVILQDKLILATGKYVTNSIPGILEVDPYKSTSKHKIPLSEYMSYATVTLEVDALQMPSLIYAAENLPIYLALRSNDDSTIENFDKAMMKDFIGKETPAAVAPVRGPSATPGKK